MQNPKSFLRVCGQLGGPCRPLACGACNTRHAATLQRNWWVAVPCGILSWVPGRSHAGSIPLFGPEDCRCESNAAKSVQHVYEK
jgi:hypothetical protein